MDNTIKFNFLKFSEGNLENEKGKKNLLIRDDLVDKAEEESKFTLEGDKTLEKIKTGNEDNINPFLVAPIVEFAKYANESVFGNPFTSSNPFSPGFQEMVSVEGVDVDVDTNEL